ncbi:hypothetical protein KSP40_PGU016213 [Platanthera guangdongensis]|uniref:Uncharacterized protein n=1 Tax=Platanthera guangdongensis TaxID=2320717 RepID=A0ABR2M823_9ASPA
MLRGLTSGIRPVNERPITNSSSSSRTISLFIVEHCNEGSGLRLDTIPTRSLMSLKQASERIKLKQYGEALDILNAAIEAYSGLSEAYLQRAFVLRHLCSVHLYPIVAICRRLNNILFEESENNYRKVLELKSGTSSVEKELSQLSQAKNALDSANNLLESGDFSKALEYIDKVVLIFSPGCLKAKLLKVKLLLALKDYSSAISETGYLLKEDENNLDALLLRGSAYYYLADHDIASSNGNIRLGRLGALVEVLPCDLEVTNPSPGSSLLQKCRAEDNAEKGKLRASVEDFKAALTMDPNHTAHNVNLYLGLCKVLVKLGRGNDAVNTCTEALNIDEELVEALTQPFFFMSHPFSTSTNDKTGHYFINTNNQTLITTISTAQQSPPLLILLSNPSKKAIIFYVVEVLGAHFLSQSAAPAEHPQRVIRQRCRAEAEFVPHLNSPTPLPPTPHPP